MTPPQMPAAPEAEQSLVAAALMGNAAVLDLVDADDFYVPAHAAVWRAMQRLRAAGEAVDVLTVFDALGKDAKLVGDVEAVSKLADGYAFGSNLKPHANIVKAMAKRRAAIRAATELAEWARDADCDFDQVMERHQEYLAQVAISAGQWEWQTSNDVMLKAFRQLQDAARAEVDPRKIRTRIANLDEATRGLSPTQMIVVAGRPGMGKSALASTIVNNIAPHGTPCLVYSLEMDAASVGFRAMSDLGNVPMHVIDFGDRRPTADDMTSMHRAAERYRQLPICLYDKPLSLPAFKSITRRWRSVPHVAKAPNALVVLDYLQLMDTDGMRGDIREQHIASISRACKLLAQELGVVVMALSQLNRSCEARQDKRPLLSDLRESGSLEQDANQVWLLYRDHVYDETKPKELAELRIAKNRSGSTCTLPLTFQGAYTRFSSSDRRL